MDTQTRIVGFALLSLNSVVGHSLGCLILHDQIASQIATAMCNTWPRQLLDASKMKKKKPFEHPDYFSKPRMFHSQSFQLVFASCPGHHASPPCNSRCIPASHHQSAQHWFSFILFLFRRGAYTSEVLASRQLFRDIASRLLKSYRGQC